MSLFENDAYRWRETYLVLLHTDKRPSAELVKAALKSLGGRYEVADVQADEQGRFDSLSVIAPDDYAAMDITYIEGEEVVEHSRELIETLRAAAVDDEERDRANELDKFTARLDVFHFEQIVFDPEAEEGEEFMDPGAVLVVLEKLAELCDGVGVDPQSNTLM